MNPQQIFSLFRKWYNRVPKVPEITTYAISCDVIRHDAIVLEVICLNNDSDRIGRHFFEPVFSLKFPYKSQKLTPKSLRIQDPKNSAEDGTLNSGSSIKPKSCHLYAGIYFGSRKVFEGTHFHAMDSFKNFSGPKNGPPRIITLCDQWSKLGQKDHFFINDVINIILFRVLAISMITNKVKLSIDQSDQANHAEVLETSETRSVDFIKMMTNIIKKL